MYTHMCDLSTKNWCLLSRPMLRIASKKRLCNALFQMTLCFLVEVNLEFFTLLSSEGGFVFVSFLLSQPLFDFEAVSSMRTWLFFFMAANFHKFLKSSGDTGFGMNNAAPLSNPFDTTPSFLSADITASQHTRNASDTRFLKITKCIDKGKKKKKNSQTTGKWNSCAMACCSSNPSISGMWISDTTKSKAPPLIRSVHKASLGCFTVTTAIHYAEQQTIIRTGYKFDKKWKIYIPRFSLMLQHSISNEEIQFDVSKI